MARKGPAPDTKVATLTHAEASRKNIPTAEFESIVEPNEKAPIRVAIERRNRDLDPQLVWRGKDEQDATDLIVSAPPLYIQEKIHPKALIDDLLRTSRERAYESGAIMSDLFSDFNGIPQGADKTEFYKHDQNWSNRMILGDSLQVMASLAEREGLRAKVQCIYIDPPYGIKFNSNFQWSTTSRDVKDGDVKQITREPEQVKAFRDTWRDGIHSYLTYLRDRLTIARDLLTDSGSIFVQIGDENGHRVRALIDEVFGADNHCATITCQKTTGAGSPAVRTDVLASVVDEILWYCKNRERLKYRQLFSRKILGEPGTTQYVHLRDNSKLTDRRLQREELRQLPTDPARFRIFAADNLTSQSAASTTQFTFPVDGEKFRPGKGYWKTTQVGLTRLRAANRLKPIGNSLMYRRYLEDFPVSPLNNIWQDVFFTGFTDEKTYVVQTASEIVRRCIQMTTDAGDLVLDPTCGSGTTAYVSEQWGRRWITIDTSRVALALARARIMGARFPFYLLTDSAQGQVKAAAVTQTIPSSQPVHGDLRQGFVCERVPHITLKSIANNSEIDVIWDKWSSTLEPLRARLNGELKTAWEEWQIPQDPDPAWPSAASKTHAEWWHARIALQKETDTSIAARAEFEYLYDRPYEESKTVRVAGPFTVESLSPHRFIGVGADEELLDPAVDGKASASEGRSFVDTMLDNLKTSGVQQAHKNDKIAFTSLVPWPGHYICAEGRYREGDQEFPIERRAAVFIGPEFGTVLKADLTAAAREAADVGFDVLIACAFAYEAYASEVVKLGKMQILKARMNADLHMASDLKKTEKANLFVIFGEPDIDITEDPEDKIAVTINGVDVFHPGTGEVRSDGPDGIACWFIDTDYNEESFFVRHAYFLGANDPYDALKKTLKAEIDEAAWESLNRTVSRPFPKPKSGRIAVKVINHLGDEVMKVFKVA